MKKKWMTPDGMFHFSCSRSRKERHPNRIIWDRPVDTTEIESAMTKRDWAVCAILALGVVIMATIAFGLGCGVWKLFSEIIQIYG